jgi:hypothetical protein
LKTIRALALAAAIALSSGFAAASGAQPPAAESPGLFIPQRSFEFQPVIDGARVVHDFAVLNKGAAPLVIENVRTG